jgi:hypothetical protein
MKAPGQVRFNLTPAMKRAMHMVHNDQIVRVYTKDGNVFRRKGIKNGAPAGVSYRLLWVLASHKMICDGETTGGGLDIECKVKLTQIGLQLLGRA